MLDRGDNSGLAGELVLDMKNLWNCYAIAGGIVIDCPPKRISSVRFGALSSKSIVHQSQVEVSTRDLFDLEQGRIPKVHGALDRRMGVSTNQAECETCHQKLSQCQGHFGHIRLALPVFHTGFFRNVLAVLQCICKECSALLLPEEQRYKFVQELNRPNLDGVRRMALIKAIAAQCRKQRRCPKCNSLNGIVKTSGPLRIVHDRFRYLSKKDEHERQEFYASFSEAYKSIPDLEKLQRKALDNLNPIKVKALFSHVDPQDYELLGLNPQLANLEDFIWETVPAPPACIRPSVVQDNASNEDDLTIKLTEIVWTSSMINAGLEKGMTIVNLMEQWDYLQLSVAMYINSDTPGASGPGGAKPIRGLCQRLKGKQGRFRGNLSGKRVDFSGRTVISPDPNLGVDQVAVPERIAKILTYPEVVTRHNKARLQTRVINGPNTYPGANYIAKEKEAARRNLRYGDRNVIAQNLRIGDIVERHLEDNDIVLFNRQPSLHRLSILAHFVKVRPWRTFRLNECVCTPYNADFDGDEMNLHVLQTEEARSEAMNLMGVKYNLVTPRSGEPIIAATQDFITASYLIAHKDSFFDRATLCELCTMMTDGLDHFDIPIPAIIKPKHLWTGKQVYSMLINSTHDSNVLLNLEAKCKTFAKPEAGYHSIMSPNDGYVVIKNSQILSGNMDKSLLGDGKKHSIFYVMLNDFGPDSAIKAMNRMAHLCARFIGRRGFSIGISDVTPDAHLSVLKKQMVQNAYNACNDLIKLYSEGKLETQPGCDEEETLEAKIGGILSKVREEVGEMCISELGRWNSPLIMSLCGSKGSTLNVSQMVALVGQQIISGSRVPNGFQDRSLPHYRKFSKEPESKGFVSNSFFSGLTPTEFFFHAISGREGLVDTAVKTAETGYMSRRLMKSLEDISASYDKTIRNSSKGIVQFEYGGDNLDPMYMEGDAKPVNFARTWFHSCNVNISDNSRNLYPYEILNLAKELLVDGFYGPENDPRWKFREDIGTFIDEMANKLAQTRIKHGLAEGLNADEQIEDDLAAASVCERLCKITKPMIVTFVQTCLQKYERAQIEPGTAVGAIGAQSIGEPGTQMTLKTFHFAGVASMNVTLGVPRIKEIINASKNISTPIITGVLANKEDEVAARIVKGRIEKTKLRDISKFIEDGFSESEIFVRIKINQETIDRLQLELTISDIARSLVNAPKLKIQSNQVHILGDSEVRIVVNEGSAGLDLKRDSADAAATALYFRAQSLCRALPDVIVAGVPSISRAVINIRDDNSKELLVEGYGLREVMNTPGVVGTETFTNHVLEMASVLGIEAARASIINEIDYTMSKHGMSVDPRHIQLLGDVMTFKGEVLGITRFGLAKMRDSVLQLASFEKTTDHLFDAAFFQKEDKVEGVSESIILGQSMHLGTGAFALTWPVRDNSTGYGKKPTLFEECYSKAVESAA
ncbi:hypothetical protein CANCADRAFT_57439 [Tortispora caseinolytica NRRL Y-17796]|uniref:DNA-directed RNA polymerase subunit n=1 Tax=Tortispora caseinolytica NRRL Y-17796 TaxID=767744 RepID=A0A1E4TH45_9ASCO|nr:hypothetical protein CANCADRAFT_57439 [Tortispora caseinolytica NRRL Y-17796]